MLKKLKEHSVAIAVLTSLLAAATGLLVALNNTSAEFRAWLGIGNKPAVEAMRPVPNVSVAKVDAPAEAKPKPPLDQSTKAVTLAPAPKLSREAIREFVQKAISFYYGVPVNTIRRDMIFEKDFPPDTATPGVLGDLRIIELAIAIEKAADCKLTDDEVEAVRTVGDILDLAARRCAGPI